ncbi:MAG: hypothetical protein AAFO82_14610, partial [Bacteroidota bacterium]
MKNSSVLICISLLLALFSCDAPSEVPKPEFQAESMKTQIIENGKLWGKALKAESDSIMALIYDEQ